MQPAKFTLRQTQETAKVTIVKDSSNSKAVVSLAVISSVAESLGVLSDFNESLKSNLLCAVRDPCTSKNCLWLEPRPTSDIEHVCSNLTVGRAVSWQPITSGLFGTALGFGTIGAVARKYYLTLHIPLKPNGKGAAAQQYGMPIEVVVTARVCANNSRVCFENRGLAGTCSSTELLDGDTGSNAGSSQNSARTGITYTQGDQLRVRITKLRDIDGLLIPPHAVDTSTDMELTFCTPHIHSSGCSQILMSYEEGSGRNRSSPQFSANLPMLRHEGAHMLTMKHGKMNGSEGLCVYKVRFDAHCKRNYKPAVFGESTPHVSKHACGHACRHV